MRSADALSWQIDRDHAATTTTVVHLTGALSGGSVQSLRGVLLGCLAECPSRVIVDLTDVDLRTVPALAVLGAVARRTAAWPGVPLALVAAGAAAREARRAGRRWNLRTRSTLNDALDVEPGPPVRRTVRALRPASQALPRARAMVSEACRAWGRDQHVLPAELIMSELVSNAIQHAGTDLEARLTYRGGTLHVTVRDGSYVPPRIPADGAGRGLLLVREFADAWGHLPLGGGGAVGKVVWATLR